MKGWWGTSGNGLILQIPGRITALCVKIGKAKPECGWFKATLTQNGNLLDQARSYGLTENVSILSSYVYMELMAVVSAASAGKSFIWYDESILVVVFARLFCRIVPRSSTTSDRYRKLAWHHLHSFIATSGRNKRGTAVGYSRHCWSSLANSPMHTPPNFLVSTRPIVVARNMQATMSY